MEDGSATLRLKIPFTHKAEIELKKVGLELVVRVAGQKRNIMLPSALAAYRPREAKFEAGDLTVRFERDVDGKGDRETNRRARATARSAS